MTSWSKQSLDGALPLADVSGRRLLNGSSASFPRAFFEPGKSRSFADVVRGTPPVPGVRLAARLPPAVRRRLIRFVPPPSSITS
jgi:hypothetical protein